MNRRILLNHKGDRVVWWAEARSNQDIYDLRVMKYDVGGLRAWHLSPEGRWDEVISGEILPEAALSVSGLLVHTLVGEEVLDRGRLSDVLAAYAHKIVEATKEKSA